MLLSRPEVHWVHLVSSVGTFSQQAGCFEDLLELKTTGLPRTVLVLTNAQDVRLRGAMWICQIITHDLLCDPRRDRVDASRNLTENRIPCGDLECEVAYACIVRVCASAAELSTRHITHIRHRSKAGAAAVHSTSQRRGMIHLQRRAARWTYRNFEP